MSTVYMISDTHFGHNNIPRYRPNFGTLEAHDTYIFNQIMQTITKRDTLWILGDIAFSMQAFNKYIVPIAEKAAVMNVCLGNHDNERIDAPLVQSYIDLGINVYGITKYKRAWVSHAPVHPAELRGKINIHGHVHGDTIPDGRYVNVSCEAIGYTPISYQSILGSLKNDQIATG